MSSQNLEKTVIRTESIWDFLEKWGLSDGWDCSMGVCFLRKLIRYRYSLEDIKNGWIKVEKKCEIFEKPILTYLAVRVLFGDKWVEVLNYMAKNRKIIWGNAVIKMAAEVNEIINFNERSGEKMIKKMAMIKILKNYGVNVDANKSYEEIRKTLIDILREKIKVPDSDKENILNNVDRVLPYFIWYPRRTIDVINGRYSIIDDNFEKIYNLEIEVKIGKYVVKFKPKDIVYQMILHQSIITCHSPGGILFDEAIDKIALPYIVTVGLENRRGQIVGRFDVAILPLEDGKKYVMGFASKVYPERQEIKEIAKLAFEKIIKEIKRKTYLDIKNFYKMNVEEIYAKLPMPVEDVDTSNDFFFIERYENKYIVVKLTKKLDSESSFDFF